MIVLYNRNKSL